MTSGAEFVGNVGLFFAQNRLPNSVKHGSTGVGVGLMLSKSKQYKHGLRLTGDNKKEERKE